MIAALLALDAQLLDGATWILAVRAAGIGGESNPVAVAAHAGGGLELVLVAKLVGALAAAAAAWWLAGRRFERHPRLRSIVLAPAVLGLFGAVTNVVAWA